MPVIDPYQFLTAQPEAAYFGHQDQWKAPNAKKFYQSQFSNIQNQYMGRLGQLAMQGQDPTTLPFQDWLKSFDWGQNFQQNAPQSMTQNTSQFNPFTRWNV